MITKHKPNSMSTTHIFIGTQKVNLLEKHYLVPNYRYVCVPFEFAGDLYHSVWTKSGKHIGMHPAKYFKEDKERKYSEKLIV